MPSSPNPSSSDSALALAEQAEAEAAEAEAAEAEALAAAATARAQSAQRRKDALDAKRKAAEEADAAESDDADEPAEPDERTRWFRRRPALTTMVTGAAAVLLVAALTVCGLMVMRHHTVTTQADREAAFIAAARQGIINLTSMDFNSAPADVQRVIDSSAGEFRDDFETRSADFIAAVEGSNATTEGTVKSVAIQSMDGDTAVLLVGASSEVSNSAAADQEPRAYRLIVTMVDEGGQIKMARVEFVP